jgi:Family of unknown function (DUF6144)
MSQYQYGRIGKLAESLENAHIAPETIAHILKGGEAIRQSTAPEDKAEWFNGAMQRMNRLLDRETRCSVREACACCLGGKRLKLSKEIANQHETLEERVAAANETRFVFGHSVALQEDGRVLVRFAPDGLEHYDCVCLPKAKEPLPVTYCYCCEGHVKHHLQIALGRKLAGVVRSSALSSGGSKPCAFLFTVQD